MSDSKARQPRPRAAAAKGRRPQFLDDPDKDRLLAMVMALVGEVAVLKERLDTHERLAVGGQVATPEAIEAFEPDTDTEQAREIWRTELLGRVFRSIRVAESPAEQTQTEQTWRALMDEAAAEK